VTSCYHKLMSTFHVYVDFDSTLYDTKRFMADLWRIITTEFVVSAKELSDDYSTHHMLGGYDFAAHMAAHGLDPAQMWRILDTLTHQDYLYEDSIAFIRTLRADGYDPRILSFGEQRFQEAKIRPTLTALTGSDPKAQSQHQRLDYEIVSHPKSEHLASIVPGEHGILVDDKPDQHLPLGFTEVHLDRARIIAKPFRETSGYTVSDLTQVYQVIQKLQANV
jgi:hypothetical protein